MGGVRWAQGGGVMWGACVGAGHERGVRWAQVGGRRKVGGWPEVGVLRWVGAHSWRDMGAGG